MLPSIINHTTKNVCACVCVCTRVLMRMFCCYKFFSSLLEKKRLRKVNLLQLNTRQVECLKMFVHMLLYFDCLINYLDLITVAWNINKQVRELSLLMMVLKYERRLYSVLLYIYIFISIWKFNKNKVLFEVTLAIIVRM